MKNDADESVWSNEVLKDDRVLKINNLLLFHVFITLSVKKLFCSNKKNEAAIHAS